MQKIRSLLLKTAALAGVLLALTVIINFSWFDEALHPDIARLMPPQPVSMDDNAYPLVYGFPAADDRDPREAGLEIIRRLRERYAGGERMTLAAEEMDEILGREESDDDWSSLYPGVSCNSRFEIDCADRLIADIAQSGPMPARLSLLTDRYETIVRTHGFQENQEFDAYTPVPPYGAILNVARIRLASRLASATTDEFLADAAADIAFWKTMLRDGQSLVAKMVALAGLRNDTTFLSALMRERPLDRAALSTVTQILTPLSDDERDIGETFLAEVRIALLSTDDMRLFVDGPPWIAGLALQEQATINEYFLAAITPLRLRASLSATEFYRQRGYEPLTYGLRVFPPPLYNLGGKYELKWIASEMSLQDYITRVHDVDGRIALVLLQAEIASRPDSSVEAVVRVSDYRNPYTLEPMDYDPRAGTIGFDCLARGDDVCALAIRREP